MSFKLLITIIVVSLLLAGSLLGYRLAFQDPVASNSLADSSSGVTASGVLATDANGQITPKAIADAEYNQLLQVIAGIETIDRSIFSKQAFTSLFDFVFPIPNPVPHRNNPFAPVGTP